MTSIATAYVTIRPDLSGFREELAAGLDADISSLDKKVRVDVDSSAAEAKLAGLDSELSALGGKEKSPKVDVSTGDARAKIDELQARIDELSSDAATVKIGVDDSKVRRTISDLQEALYALRNETLVPGLNPARIEEINGELDGLDGRLARVGEDLGSVSLSADRASAAMGTGSGGAGGGGLMAAAMALTPALVSVGAVGAGALAALGTSAVSAGLVLGAFGVAAEGSLSTAKTEAAGLLSQWQQTQAGFTNPVIEKAVGLLPGVFNLLAPSVATASSALQGLEGRLAGSIGSPYWTRFSTYLAGEGGAAITSFGSLIGGLGTALAGLAEGLAPELSRIDSDVQRWATDLDQWGHQAANGGLSSFVSYIQANGPLLAHTVEQIGSDFATLAKDAAPLGPVWLNTINVLARLLGGLEGISPVLTGVVASFAGLGYEVNKLTAPIGGLTGAFSLLKGAVHDVGNFSAIVNGSEAAVGPIGRLATGLGSAAGAGAAAGAAGEAAAISIGALVVPLGIAAGSVIALGAAFAILGSRAQSVDQQLASMASSWAQSFVQQAENTGMSNSALITLLETEEKQLATQSYMKSSNLELNDRLKDLQAAEASLKAQTDGANDALNAMATSSGQASTSGNTLGLTLNQLNSDTQNVTSQLSGLSNILQVVSGNAVALATTDNQVHQAFDSLSQSIQTNSNDFFTNSDRAAANQAALANVVQAIDQHITAMAKQGQSVQAIDGYLTENAGHLAAVMTQAGLTTGQIEQLLAQYGLTPAQIQTIVSAPGLQQAISGAQNLTSSLNSIPRSVVSTITTIFQQVGSAIGFGHASGLRPGTMSAHMAVVGEQGPELMKSERGVEILGQRGPQVAYIPAGAEILTAQETARLPRHADGLGPRPLGATALDGELIALLSALVSEQQRTSAALEAMPVQVALLKRTGAL